MSEALGIFQSDLMIRSALIEAFKDLRKNPWLLDYMFRGLSQDAVTAGAYGDKQIAEAKKWLLKTDITIYYGVASYEGPKFPCITITMASSSEAEVSLADTHHETHEPLPDDPVVAGPFTPKFYDPMSGKVVLPKEIGDANYIMPGMVLVDAGGQRHEISEVIDDYTMIIAAKSRPDFTATTLRYGKPALQVELESVAMKEDYLIGCHALEPLHLIILHSAVVFILLRYKQSLLELRGFERSTFSSTDFTKFSVFDEPAFSRYINLTGYIRQFWPKAIQQTIQTVQVSALRPIGSGKLPADTDPDEALWAGDEDALTLGFRGR